MGFKLVFTKFMTIFLTLAVLLLITPSAWAAFGEDIERPQPKFTQDGADWIAELIPRGKSTRVQIRFHAEGGTLAEPVPKIFGETDGPKIDVKNYRSGFFVVDMTPSTTGGKMTLSLGSSYFNSATDIWGVRERASQTWGTTEVVNISPKGEPVALRFGVRDGGVLDEDGEVNGRIQVVIGPRDHFWGYAIGTLVIRFFGVFLVLGILMIGMILSGRLFQSMDRGKPQPQAAAPALPDGSKMDALEMGEPEIPAPAPDPKVTPAMAAAIGLALHLHARGVSQAALPKPLAPTGSSWSLSGRTQIMADRRSVFDRVQNK